MEHFLIERSPANIAGFFFAKNSLLLLIKNLTKTVLKVSLYYAYLLPLPE
ncbi:hypothetical protein COM96_08415 [Bacillus cereus]|uniref:Uncharacterized protein n=1 Tax=Bacillus cereus TaxID=1396 RepID=A0A2A7I051_BACCE|nr:hypothetical protein COM96_08415 [Bacillus cereus]